MSRELLKQALESLKGYRRNTSDSQACDTEKLIEEYLTKPEPEPFIYAIKHYKSKIYLSCSKEFNGNDFWSKPVPLYAEPPRQEPVRLSDEEIVDIFKGWGVLPISTEGELPGSAKSIEDAVLKLTDLLSNEHFQSL